MSKLAYMDKTQGRTEKMWKVYEITYPEAGDLGSF
jgi:hypothetical protein